MVGIPSIFTSDGKTKWSHLYISLAKLAAKSNRSFLATPLVVKLEISLVSQESWVFFLLEMAWKNCRHSTNMTNQGGCNAPSGGCSELGWANIEMGQLNFILRCEYYSGLLPCPFHNKKWNGFCKPTKSRIWLPKEATTHFPVVAASSQLSWYELILIMDNLDPPGLLGYDHTLYYWLNDGHSTGLYSWFWLASQKVSRLMTIWLATTTIGPIGQFRWGRQWWHLYYVESFGFSFEMLVHWAEICQLVTTILLV